MIPPESVAGHLADLAPYMSLVAECQVLDFSTRAQYGPWIKIRLAEPGMLQGLEAGQRFHLMLIKIGDDEMPAALEGKERKPYKLSQLAGLLCNEEQFRHWVTREYGDACPDYDTAAQWLRESCGVESRAYLDSNETAAEIFRGIMADYDAYKQEQEPAA